MKIDFIYSNFINEESRIKDCSSRHNYYDCNTCKYGIFINERAGEEWDESSPYLSIEESKRGWMISMQTFFCKKSNVLIIQHFYENKRCNCTEQTKLEACSLWEDCYKPRKTLSKEIRKIVYQKCNGHCAYCGKKITLKEMQVDHIKCHAFGGEDCNDNYLPSCRRDNFYKSTQSIEEYREYLEGLPKRWKRHKTELTTKLGLSYKLITKTGKLKPHKIKFYFEMEEII